MNNNLFIDNWQFHEFEIDTPYEEMADFTNFCDIDIPHDWMIGHTNALYSNSIGFYRKVFKANPQKGHIYYLRFEGVYMDCEIYCNRQKVFTWKYGYSTFDVNLTDYLVSGENSIFVICKYQDPNTRWYSGAGIYRNVWFFDKESVSFVPDGIYTSTKETSDGFLLTIDEEIQSTEECEILLKNTLSDPDGNIITILEKPIKLQIGKIKVSGEINVSSVYKWDIIDPNLYTLSSEIIYGEMVKDFSETKIGFRTISFDCNKGFSLNGRIVKINGACMHHDLGALGAAVNKSALRRQLEKLLKMGVNSIRTSHNMPSVELMELADEMGILINSEAFDMWELPKTTYDYSNFFPEWWEKDVESWIRRDRNHPSVIIWSIGNEIYDTHAGTGLKWTVLLRDKVRELDYMHNAYIGIGSNYIAWENAQKCSDELELSGFNYGESLYDGHHKKYRDWCIFGSETGSTVQSRGIYHFPYEITLLTHKDGQCSCLGNCTTNWGSKSVNNVIADHRDRDFVFGQYIWTGFDYIGEPTPYHSKNSYFGQLDTAGFEKDTYYHYQAEWTDYKKAPMVHLLPYWDFNEGQIIDVIAYSNAPYVELFFNGESMGRQFIDHLTGIELQAHWKLPYKKGVLVAKAYDEKGNLVASDEQRSFGDPALIMLKPENDCITADGRTLAFIEISMADKEGTFVANARNRVNVKVSGPGRLLGLDNGDSTDYEEYKGSSRKLFSGKLLAIVAPTNEPGTITVTVSSKGLKDASVSIESKPSYNKEDFPCQEKNFESAPSEDIAVRKIELTCEDSFTLNKDKPSARVRYKVLPENATYKEVSFAALTKDSVDANYAKIEKGDGYADITALGDGSFSLTAYCCNDKEHPEVISTLDFSIEGIGMANFNPYSMIPGIQYSKAFSEDCKLSFLGGVFLPYDGTVKPFVTYENVDFGPVGSNTVHVPIFSFKDELPLKIFSDKELLFEGTYRAKSIYNEYQENVFTINRVLRGTHTITFEFNTDDRISLQGFYFSPLKKAYSIINSTDFSEIAGDTYSVCDSEIKNIGNNVSISYDNMNFDEGISRIRIVGKSHNEKTSLHILYIEDGVVTRDMVDIPYSEEYSEFFFDLKDVHTNGKINLVFLPGTDFDLKEFEFFKK